jgi:2'-5' RNA ligase
MRTFIAIKLPKEIKGLLASLQQELKNTGADVKWVEPKNIHLTLKFLGEIDEKTSTKISSILEEVAKDTMSFNIRIACAGAFPKINSPRVLWAGVDKGDLETKIIAKALEEKIEKIGIPKENRAFSSHITIGRIKSSLNRDELIQGLKKLQKYFGAKGAEFCVYKITLFKSTLTPNGPIYEILKEANLKTI